MDKDKLLAALNALQNSDNEAGAYHDELGTLITLVINAKDADITSAREDIHLDTDENAAETE